MTIHNKVMIVYMKVNEISRSELNWKEFREDDKAILDLIHSMREDGFWEYMPLILSGVDGKLGDGHRRLAAARILEMEEVPVLVVPDKDSMTIWAKLNSTRLRINGQQWLYAYQQGLDLFEIPKPTRGYIAGIIDTCGEDANKIIAMLLDPSEFGKNRPPMAPTIYKEAKIFLTAMGKRLRNDKEYYVSPEKIKRCIIWMAKYQLQNVIRIHLQTKKPALSDQFVIDSFEADEDITGYTLNRDGTSKKNKE